MAVKPSATGKLIAIEGIDGAGTTTQCTMLKDALLRHDIAAHLTAEPSDGPIGKLLRRALRHEEPLDDLALVPLFAADRLDHVAREIAPQLAQGRTVITDRYVLSSYAYQALIAPLEYVKVVNELARPADLSVFVRVSADIAEQRRNNRGGTKERFDARAHQDQIAQRYEHALTIAGPHVVVDGDASVEVVHQAILQHVLGLFAS